MKSFVLLLAVVAARPLAAADLPLVIPAAGGGAPVWRDARSFDAKGESAPPLLSSERARIGALLARPVDGACIPVGGNDDYALGPHKPTFAGEGPKLARLFQAAQLVVVVRVSAVSQGFADGIPATLAELDSVEVLYAARAFPAQRTFVALPVASFPVAGRTICKSSDLYPAAAPGSQMLLFVADFWGDTGQVLRVAPLQAIPLPDKGDVRVPWNLEALGAKEPPRERERMLAYLRGLARERTATAAAGAAAPASSAGGL